MQSTVRGWKLDDFSSSRDPICVFSSRVMPFPHCCAATIWWITKVVEPPNLVHWKWVIHFCTLHQLFQLVNADFMFTQMNYVVKTIGNPRPSLKKNNLWYMCGRIPSFMVIYHVWHMVSATPPWAPAIDKAECETWKDLLDLGPNGLTIAVLAARQPEIGDVTPNSRIVTIRACENVEGFLSLSKMSYLCLSVCLDAYS